MSVMDRFSLTGRCAIVTGAAMGLGKAMAEALADAGCSIVIADIQPQAATATAEELRARGVTVQVTACDVTSEADAARLVDETVARFGRIDVLINNAGICIHENAESMSLAQWRSVMSVNLDGVFIMSRAVGQQMIKQQSGSIINISSMSGLIVNTPQNQCAYNASKAGVIMLTKSLAAEWAGHRIRVNAVAPGYMKTDLTRRFFEEANDAATRWMAMSPMGRPGTPDELGGIALYLASDASSFATGGVFVIDGGYTAW